MCSFFIIFLMGGGLNLISTIISLAIWAHRFLFYSKTSYVSILLWIKVHYIQNTFKFCNSLQNHICFLNYWDDKANKSIQTHDL